MDICLVAYSLQEETGGERRKRKETLANVFNVYIKYIWKYLFELRRLHPLSKGGEERVYGYKDFIAFEIVFSSSRNYQLLVRILNCFYVKQTKHLKPKSIFMILNFSISFSISYPQSNSINSNSLQLANHQKVVINICPLRMGGSQAQLILNYIPVEDKGSWRNFSWERFQLG